jgi:hypothetical protein
MRPEVPLLAFLLMPLTLALPACQKLSGPDANPLELRTYSVPKGAARSLETVVKDVFDTGANTPPVGRASITPDGRLAVVAPRNVQAGVQSLVDDVSKNPPAAEPTIDLHYWLLVGRPASTPSAAPPDAKEIEGALAEIQRTSGPQTFTGFQRMDLATLNTMTGTIEAENLKIRQHAVQTEDGVLAAIKIDLVRNPGRLDTMVHLAPDQVVVLASTRPQAGDAGDGATLYYLVRVAPRADGRHP